jgi:hypothetical protein
MLANRNHFIPGGFRFVQPEISDKELGDVNTSFDVLVNRVIELRKANPALAKKNNLSLDHAAVANEVDAYNTAICQAHGWTQFITTYSPFPQASRSPLLSRLENAAGSVNRVAAGVRTLLDWLGSGGRPVDSLEAEQRASICGACPLNKPGDWKSYFTQPVAREIGLQLEMKHKLNLKTSRDDALNVCTGCDCPLKLKVWTPMEHILRFTTEETKKRLDARCWILKA